MITKDEWWDLLEVRMAERLSGGDPAAFLETLISIIDSGVVEQVKSQLDSRGLHIDDVMDMRSKAAMAEGENDSLTQAAPSTRESIKRLFLARFDDWQIAEILDIDQDKVETCVASMKMSDISQKIVELHLAGKTRKEIASECDTSFQRVDQLLRNAGFTPHSERKHSTAEEREKILALRRQGLGYTAISRQVGVDYYHVRAACRAAVKNGLLSA